MLLTQEAKEQSETLRICLHPGSTWLHQLVESTAPKVRDGNPESAIGTQRLEPLKTVSGEQTGC